MRKYWKLAFVVVTAAWLFTACQEPSPLLGTWSDNSGNRLTLINDGSFIMMLDGERYEGTFTTLINAITFSVKTNGTTVVSEWDIRGNMLYLTWRTSTKQTALTLYKIS